MTARSLRNNNPLNIRIGSPWQGLMDAADMTPEQAAEKEFCVFASAKWGFRAAARLLISYKDKDKIHTIAGVIGKWAPASENDTLSYIADVCKQTGRAPDAEFDAYSYADAFPVLKAMATHEAGGWLFSDDDLSAGLTLAGVPKPLPPVSQSPTVQVAAGATAAVTGITAVTQVLQQAEPALNIIQSVHAWWPTLAAVIALGALGAVLYIHLKERRRAPV